MQPTLTAELYWLALTVLMTALLWVPYVLNQIVEMGLWAALKSYNPDVIPKGSWAYRSMRAHMNAVENLVLFAALVLALQVLGISTPLTATACMVYFVARAAHYVVYTLGIPLARTLAFFVGFVVQVVLALTLLGLV